MEDPSLPTTTTTTTTTLPSSSNPSKFLTNLTTSPTTPPLLQGQAKVCLKLNTNFHDRSQELEVLRERLRGWVEERGEKDGWGEERRREVEIWLGDVGVCWRGLRRALYDHDKAFQIITDSLTTLLTHSLLSPIIPSFPPFTSPPTPTSPPIFTILPYPTFSDPLDRPIAIITLRCLQRDFGKDVKDRLKEWSYWCAEMMRRCLWDVDERRRGRGREGEEVRGSGCVLVIDVKNAGFKNIDLDLLPHMLPILQSYYPGLFSTIYIVNASWTHASMWGVMKRLLPKTTLDRIRFLEKGEVGQVFDLERWPKAYGGKSGWDVGEEGKEEGEVWERYSWGSWEEGLEKIRGIKGSQAESKKAEEKVEFPLRKDNDSALDDGSESGSEEEEGESDEGERTDRLRGFELHLSPSRTRNASLPPLESPSMAQAVAAVGLQRHSISSIRPTIITPPRPPPGRLSLDSNARSYSASLQEHHARRLSETTVEAERRMARKRLLKEEEDMAKAREGESDRRGSSSDRRNEDGGKRRRFMIEQDDSDDEISSEDSPTRSRDRRKSSSNTFSSELAERRRSSGLPISAYDKLMNPMFGYPAVALPAQPQQLQVPSPPSPSSSFTSYGTNASGSTFNNAPIPGLVTFTTVPRNVVPLHGRRRKRDLAKTLFLLSIVRLVGIKDWFTSLLSEMGRLMWGLLVLRRWWSSMADTSGRYTGHARGRTGMYARGRDDTPLTPDSGFRSQLDPFSSPESARGGATLERRSSGKVVRGNALVSQDDWLWLLLSLLVVRGSWGRALVSVWEALRTAVRALSGGKLAHG